MAGPYPPYPPVGAEGQPFPGSFPVSPYPGGYPGALPPPVNYPAPPRRRRALWWGLAALAAIGALAAAAVLLSGSRPAGGTGSFSDATAKSAIQGYLTALSDRDTETIARNNSCGMYDAIRDRKSDMALAKLASDAFSKQFARAEVTSVDKIVLSSPYQAQVLFTMKVLPGPGSRNAREQQQGMAQLLRQGDQVLVCSYLLRTGAQY
jgi:hypothetical protein